MRAGWRLDLDLNLNVAPPSFPIGVVYLLAKNSSAESRVEDSVALVQFFYFIIALPMPIRAD